MKNTIILLLLSVAFLAVDGCQGPEKKSGTDIKQSNQWYQAAEYAPMKAVWLLFPQVTHKKSIAIPNVTLSSIEALVPSVHVNLVVPNDSLQQIALSLIPDSLIKNGSVSILRFPYAEFWARDMGPAFLVNDKGEKAIADFMFNNWGYNDTTDARARIDEKLDEKIAAFYHLPLVSTNVVSEGGDHEVNGKGTLLLAESVERTRNPNMTATEIENEFKRVLGVSTIIWLKQGVRDDDHSFLGAIDGPDNKKYYTVLTTNGHVDEYARFVNDSTIVLAWVDSADRNSPVEIETGKRMEVNYSILTNSKDQNGAHFKILKMPMPYPVTNTLQPGDGVYDVLSTFTYSDGSTFPNGKKIDVIAAASYLNFLIANDRVLMAKYWKPGMSLLIKERDEEAQGILQKAFPDKKIIALDALAVNLGGGGIHCITMNEPK